MKKLPCFSVYSAALFFLMIFPAASWADVDDVRHFSLKIVKVYPHDRTAFTQGLIYDDGYLYESTGLYGRSKIKVIDLTNDRVIKSIDLGERYFGEGLTVKDDQLVQLTYRERQGFVYDRQTLKVTNKFDYPTEGWGITYDGSYLIMSNGSSHLFYLDPSSYRRVRSLAVEKDGTPVANLNELEYIDGLIFANIWMTNAIVQIDPESGRIVGEIDCSELAKRYEKDGNVDVLNGIAYDRKDRRLFVTGKLWPELFEVELVPVQDVQ
jgi:glutamine cyclotransferase